MNKEYFRISDELLYVTNEKGKLKDRKIVNNIHNILISENKLEYITSLIEELNKELTNDKEILDFIKLWKKVHNFVITIFLIIAILTIFWLKKTEVLTIWIVYTLIVNVYANTIKKYKQKKVMGLTEEIKVANEIKEEFEKEFEEVKNRKLSDEQVNNTRYVAATEEEIEKYKIYIVPTDEFKTEQERLEEAYNIGYNSQTKKLVKQR